MKTLTVANAWPRSSHLRGQAKTRRPYLRDYRTQDVDRKSFQRHREQGKPITRLIGSGVVSQSQDEDYKPGQLKNGFNLIVRDFDEAVHRARFPSLWLSLIYEARKASWAEATRSKNADPLSFLFNPTDLAVKYGCDRKSVKRAFDALLIARVFVPSDDGRFQINKDFREWLDPERVESLFDEHAIENILQSSALLRMRRRGTSTSPEGGANVPKPHNRGDVNVPLRGRKCPAPAALAPPILVPPLEPPVERAPVDSLRERENISSCAASREERTGTQADNIPPYPTEDGPLEIMPGAHPMAPNDAKRIWRILWQAFADQKISNEWYEHQAWYPAECWIDAIREVHRRGTKPGSINYLQRVATAAQAGTLKKPDSPPGPTLPGLEPPRPSQRGTPPPPRATDSEPVKFVLPKKPSRTRKESCDEAIDG